MAQVSFGLSQHPLGRQEKAAKRTRSNSKIGELEVSQGGLRWYPSGVTAKPHTCT